MANVTFILSNQYLPPINSLLSSIILRNLMFGWVWWDILVISALGKLRLKDHLDFKTTVSYGVRLSQCRSPTKIRKRKEKMKETRNLILIRLHRKILVILGLGRRRQRQRFQVILGYIMGLKPAWTTLKHRGFCAQYQLPQMFW